MRRNFNILTLVLVGLFLCSCTFTAAEPTVTPLPTLTQTATQTSTPLPTQTPQPTLTPTLTPTHTPEPTFTATVFWEEALNLGPVLKMPVAGFSLQPSLNYGLETGYDVIQIMIDNENLMYFYQMMIVEDSYAEYTYEEIIDSYLARISEKNAGDFLRSEEFTSIMIDSFEGKIFDLSGEFLERTVQGQIVLVSPRMNYYLLVLGIAHIDEDDQSWKNYQYVFDAILETITFFEPAMLVEGSFCAVSSESSYGYTMENPIRVGGDIWEGPSNERLYLDSLSGPNGEEITYERHGSIVNVEDIVLDIYVVDYPGKTVNLYLDMYNFETPLAPQGFICWTEIPLGAQ